MRKWAESIVAVVKDLGEEVSFIGELSVKLTESLLHPLRLRWQDAMLIAEKTGANAVGIVSLMGFLIGLILAFQSAVPMKLFGAEIFVADLVAISLFRELGPLITAIIVASRTGSSFAAEIGTMTVNEEVDALVTMGLDPVKFLVIPRVLSTIFVMPLLTMFNNHRRPYRRRRPDDIHWVYAYYVYSAYSACRASCTMLSADLLKRLYSGH